MVMPWVHMLPLRPEAPEPTLSFSTRTTRAPLRAAWADGGESRQCADRHLEEGQAPFGAVGGERLDLVEGRVGEPALPPGQPAAGRGLLAAPVLAAEQAVGQRVARQQSDAVAQAGRDQVLLHAAVEQVVAVLGGHEGVRDLLGREVGATDVPDLALVDQLLERRDRLLQRRDAVRFVVLVQVDPVGAEPVERCLDRVPDVGAGSARTVQVGVPAHLHAELGGQHHVGAAALERGAKQPFTVAAEAAPSRLSQRCGISSTARPATCAFTGAVAAAASASARRLACQHPGKL
jgi:hypothetical protein